MLYPLNGHTQFAPTSGFGQILHTEEMKKAKIMAQVNSYYQQVIINSLKNQPIKKLTLEIECRIMVDHLLKEIEAIRTIPDSVLWPSKKIPFMKDSSISFYELIPTNQDVVQEKLTNISRVVCKISFIQQKILECGREIRDIEAYVKICVDLGRAIENCQAARLRFSYLSNLNIPTILNSHTLE